MGLSLFYRAVDGALIVILGDEELCVDLPNWNLEEGHSVVRSIQLGDCSVFHEAMALGATQVGWSIGSASSHNQGIPPGEIAIGQVGPDIEIEPPEIGDPLSQSVYSEENQLPEERGATVEPEVTSLLEEESSSPISDPWWAQALDQFGWTGWMLFSGCLCVGSVVLFRLLLGLVWELLTSGSGQAIVDLESGVLGQGRDLWTALAALWTLSALRRGGILLPGFQTAPFRVSFGHAARLQGSTVELSSLRLRIWLLLVILFGLAEPNEAREEQGQVVLAPTSVLVSPAEDVCARSRVLTEGQSRGIAREAVKICAGTALWGDPKTGAS